MSTRWYTGYDGQEYSIEVEDRPVTKEQVFQALLAEYVEVRTADAYSGRWYWIDQDAEKWAKRYNEAV